MDKKISKESSVFCSIWTLGHLIPVQSQDDKPGIWQREMQQATTEWYNARI